MYWPSTSSDGEFVFQHRDGEEIDADAVLARYKDWHDTSEYPVSSRQKKNCITRIEETGRPSDKAGNSRCILPCIYDAGRNKAHSFQMCMNQAV